MTTDRTGSNQCWLSQPLPGASRVQLDSLVSTCVVKHLELRLKNLRCFKLRGSFLLLASMLTGWNGCIQFWFSYLLTGACDNLQRWFIANWFIYFFKKSKLFYLRRSLFFPLRATGSKNSSSFNYPRLFQKHSVIIIVPFLLSEQNFLTCFLKSDKSFIWRPSSKVFFLKLVIGLWLLVLIWKSTIREVWGEPLVCHLVPLMGKFLTSVLKIETYVILRLP